MVLVGESCQLQSGSLGSARYRGEIHMRGQILFSGIFQWVIHAPMRAVGSQCAGCACWMVTDRCGVSVVDDEHPAGHQFSGQGLHPRFERRTDFRRETGNLAINRRCFSAEWRFGENEPAVFERDTALEPASPVANEQLDRKSIEQLVGEKNAGEFRKFRFARHVDEMCGPWREGVALRGAQTFYRLDDDNARQRSFPRGKNIGHELSVVCALFDERELIRFSEQFPHLEKLGGEEFSENRSDAHVGEKVPALSRAILPRGVVAAARMIQRHLHEFVEPDGAILRDAPTDFLGGSAGPGRACGHARSRVIRRRRVVPRRRKAAGERPVRRGGPEHFLRPVRRARRKA